MPINKENYSGILQELLPSSACLVAVSKTKPADDVMELYEAGQRDFGENYVQELLEKQPALPGDIRWHFIGHLQTNKVKYIAPFVYLIHGVDSLKLLLEINKQGKKLNRRIPVLLQMYIATEETKFGMDYNEAEECLQLMAGGQLPGVEIKGLMGMASFSENPELVKTEFRQLASMHQRLKQLPGGIDMEILSMGMSGDYKLALEQGSNMVRIGSLLFGARNYLK
jgi:pyridoxal phosphate enzyme (YggS family)